MENTLSTTRRRWFGKLLGWSSIGLLVLGLAAFLFLGIWDRAARNLALGASLAIGGLLGWLWLMTHPAVRGWLRFAVLAAPIIAGLSFARFYRFNGFSGEMVPQFRHRSAVRIAPPPAPDRPSLPTMRPEVPLASFRQFLGNDRNGVVNEVRLPENWESAAPRVLWSKPMGAGWSGFVVQNGLAVSMEEFDGEDCLVALDWNDGSIRWRTLIGGHHYNPAGGGGPRATPTIDGDHVYTQSSTGIVACCRLDDGTLLWKTDLLEKAGIDQKESEEAVSWGRSGSPLLVEQLVVVPFGGAGEGKRSSLIALDRTSGEERWRGGQDQISYASPALLTLKGVPQIVIVNESTASGHDPKSGNLLWSYPWRGQSNGSANVSQAVWIDESSLLLSKGYGVGAALLDFSQSSPPEWKIVEKWNAFSLLKTKFTNAVLRDGYLYGLNDGTLECVCALDGKRAWKDGRNGRFGHGQLLIVGEHLLVSSEDGRLVMGKATPTHFQKIGELSVLKGITWNTLAIAGNRIIMRNGEEAACIEIKLEEKR